MFCEILSRTKPAPTQQAESGGKEVNVWFSSHAADDRSSRLDSAMPELAKDLRKFADKIRKGIFYYDGPADTYYCVLNKLYVCVLRREPDPVTDRDGFKVITVYPYTKHWQGRCMGSGWERVEVGA